MHKRLLYGGYGFLLTSGVLHFFIDVVGQHVRHKRTPGPETTMYYGLHSAYSLGQVVFALAAFMIMRTGSDLMSRPSGQTLGFAAATGWLAVCLRFIEYAPPKYNILVVQAFLTAAALTKPTATKRCLSTA
jgi:hypothetical protein